VKATRVLARTKKLFQGEVIAAPCLKEGFWLKWQKQPFGKNIQSAETDCRIVFRCQAKHSFLIVFNLKGITARLWAVKQ